MEVLNRLPGLVSDAAPGLPLTDLRALKRALTKMGGRIFSPLVQPDLCRLCTEDPALFHELMLETLLSRDDHVALNIVHPGLVAYYESLLFPEEFIVLCGEVPSLLAFRVQYERMMDALSAEIRSRRSLRN